MFTGKTLLEGSLRNGLYAFDIDLANAANKNDPSKNNTYNQSHKAFSNFVSQHVCNTSTSNYTL